MPAVKQLTYKMSQQAAPLLCRTHPDCVSDFEGYVSAFVFAVATQQTIGGLFLQCRLLPERFQACHRTLLQDAALYRSVCQTPAAGLLAMLADA